MDLSVGAAGGGASFLADEGLPVRVGHDSRHPASEPFLGGPSPVNERTILSIASSGDTHPTAGRVPLGSTHMGRLVGCFYDNPRETPPSNHPEPGHPARQET